MSDYQTLFSQIKSQYFNKLDQVCQPIYDLFQIKYFSYQQVDLNGRYQLLGTHPDFLDYYLDKAWYKEDPFLISPHLYSPGLHLFNLTEHVEMLDEPTQLILRDMEIKYGFSQNILFVLKQEKFYEIFFFSLAKRNKEGIKSLYKNYKLIEKFFDYFRKSMQHELCEIIDMNLNIATIRNTSFNKSNYTSYDSLNERNFLSEISSDEFELIKMINTLTHREAECLYWLIHGKTAKETAEILNISIRTVEIYREKCRFKFKNISFYSLVYKIGKYDLLDLLILRKKE